MEGFVGQSRSPVFVNDVGLRPRAPWFLLRVCVPVDIEL